VPFVRKMLPVLCRRVDAFIHAYAFRIWVVLIGISGAFFSWPAIAAERSITHALGAGYVPVKELSSEQSRLVFYRPEEDGLGVITLHIDGRYHTSLQNGAFSVICLDRALVNLQAQPGRSWARADPSREVSQNVVMSGGQTLFVRLTEALATRPRMDVVPSHVAEQEVQTTRQQTHSLSRVTLAKPCMEVTTPSLVFAPEVVTLSAQSAQDSAELAQLIKRLESRYRIFPNVSLHIVGYAQDFETEARNDAFSKELASSVQRFWMSQSTQFAPITSEGRGSKDRQNVGDKPPRRVEIGITVLRN
jgi:outer membrane protein OmpA-like peptidoglycan-associated protein